MEAVDIQEAVSTVCAKWQERLRLQDWTVDVRVKRKHDMTLSDALASCEWYMERKDAIIEVVDPIDLDSYKGFLNGEEGDYDVSIVHELLHLHFAPFTPREESHQTVAIEQAINAISKALVRLEREKLLGDHMPASMKPKDPQPLPEHVAPAPVGAYL